MARLVARRSTAAPLPQWVRLQLTQLADTAPEADRWLHEINYDGYRMHARLYRGRAKLLTRNGLDWTHKYPVPTSCSPSTCFESSDPEPNPAVFLLLTDR